MADWVLNLVGNLGAKSAEEAAQVGKLTAAMKAEEAALKRMEIARVRATSGTQSDIKAVQKLNSQITESKARIDNLSKVTPKTSRLKDALFGAKPSKGVIEKPISDLFKSIKTDGILGSLDKLLQKAAVASAKAAAAGVVLVSASVLAGAVALGTFGVRAADSARSAKLLNEAADIAGGSGHKLDAVIRQISNDVPTAKDEIAKLARELSVARFSGREAQLALGAASVASSALGDSAGSSIVQIATQSRAIRRFTLGAKDIYREYTSLAGTGLKSADVIGALAKQLKTSVPAAEAALRSGRVKVEDGLAALEMATKAKFGGIVAKQMLSLDVQTRKLGEHLADLFSDVNAEPALKGLHDVLGVFDSTTYAGDTLKALLTAVFNDLSGAAEGAAPKLRSFFLGLEAGALQFYIAIKPTLKALGSPDIKGADGISSSFKAGEAAAKALGQALADVLSLMQQISSAAGVVKDIGSIFIRPKSVDLAKGVGDKAESVALGASVAAGIQKGIEQNTSGPVGAMITMADAMKAAFAGPKGIDSHSPSKAFEKRAEMIPAGTVKGVEKGIPDVQAAVIDMGNVRGGSVTHDNRKSVGDVNITVQALGDAALLRLIDTRVVSILKAVADQGAQ